MKKHFVLIFGITLLFIIILVLIFKNQKPFYLENKYYKDTSLEEINIKKLNNLINKKESFGLFVYQSMCFSSDDFESVLKKFQKDYQVGFYKISFSNISKTTLKKYIKYYPSFIIFKKGKVIDYLEADKDQDVESYTSKKGFAKWFLQYVKLQ